MKLSADGFSLTELLISLLILGVIFSLIMAKFVITTQTQSEEAKTREAYATVSEAFNRYLLESGNYVLSTTTGNVIIPYLNHVQQVTSGTVDADGGSGSWNCASGTFRCFLLHNGAILAWDTRNRFGNPSSRLSYIWFRLDLDGTAVTGRRLSEGFILYVKGAATSWNNCKPGSVTQFNSTLEYWCG